MMENTSKSHHYTAWPCHVLGFALAANFMALTYASAEVEMEHVVLHHDDTMYYLGPSLAVLRNGDILMGLREAHARPANLRGHVDPTARGVFLRSKDGGRTFGEKRVVDDETLRFSSSQDTTLTALSDGSILTSIYSWGIAPVPTGIDLSKIHTGKRVVGPEKPFISVFEGLWTRHSKDGGRTWTPRRRVDIEGMPPLAARTPVVELGDGTLLIQVNDLSRGVGTPRDWARVFCLRSADKGATWGEPALAAEGAHLTVHFLEPSLVRLRSGRLISMLRTRGEGPGADERVKNEGGDIGTVYAHYGHIFQTVSDDDGRTWSKPEQTPMWGFPAHVLELQDGRLLCAYGYRRKPYGVRATLSLDGGKTWDIGNEIVIRDDGGTSDLGYPFSIQLPGGEVLIAYYFNREKPGDPESNTRYIAGTFLKLN
jgi:sialidase-1